MSKLPRLGTIFITINDTLKKVSVKPDEVCGTDDKKTAAFLIPSGDVNYAIRYQ